MRVLVYEGAAPARLDRFLLESCLALRPAALHKALRQNKIKLNGKSRPLSTRLAAGDEVRLYLPEAAFAPPAPPLRVLFEDENLLAVDKPAGLVSLAAEEGNRDSLLCRAQAYLAGRGGAAGSLALCHRLDTGTSGILLLAKNPAMLAFVEGLIRTRRLEKTYLGVTFGHLQPAAGALEHWLRKDAATGRVHLVPPRTGGAKPAKTAYRTIAARGPLALVSLSPYTGRTHQIRAQLAGAGAPLLGDSKYGNLAANRRWRCRYQCLCARTLRFPATDGAFAAYSGLLLTCEAPWYYGQMLDGTLGRR